MAFSCLTGLAGRFGRGPGGRSFMNAALSQPVHHPWFWRGDDLAFVASTLPTGYEALDRELPGGGWPRGQLIELLADDQGIGELRLLVPALRVLVGAGG